jgi:hypothetical protein
MLLDCSFVTLSAQSLWALAHLTHLMTLYLMTNSEVNNEVAPFLAGKYGIVQQRANVSRLDGAA